MKKKKCLVGDIVVIPVEGAFIPAKVLYVSNEYRNVILLGVYGVKQPQPEMPDALPNGFLIQLYTTQIPIQKGIWQSISHEDLRPEQVGLAKRISGGNVMHDDTFVRDATDEDYKSLPQMLVCGSDLVATRVAKAFAALMK